MMVQYRPDPYDPWDTWAAVDELCVSLGFQLRRTETVTVSTRSGRGFVAPTVNPAGAVDAVRAAVEYEKERLP